MVPGGQVLLDSSLTEAGGSWSPRLEGAFREVKMAFLFFSPWRILKNLWKQLEQLTGLEVPLVFGLQEGGRRLLSRVFHRPTK